MLRYATRRYLLSCLLLSCFISTTASLRRTLATNEPRPNATPIVSLPAPWDDIDVGSVGVPGSATYSADSFTVSGSGQRIGGTSDEFNFVYQPYIGDADIEVHVEPGRTNNIAKVGIMMRGDLSPGAPYVSMLLTQGSGPAFQFRKFSGVKSKAVSSGGLTNTTWLKLSRSGSVFTGYTSSDGLKWTLAGSVTINMSSRATVGLAVSSGTDSALYQATFDSVTYNGGSLGVSLVTVNSANVIGGSSAQGVVTINGPAPPQGVNVGLISNNPSLVSVPQGVTVLGGSTTAIFPVTTSTVSATASANIIASYGATSATTVLTLVPNTIVIILSSITVNPPSVTGGSSAQGTVTLNATAPSGGANINLTSDTSSVATVPASVTVPAGSSSATFVIATNPVAVTSNPNITAVWGTVSHSASLSVVPPIVSGLSMSPGSVVGGNTFQGTVTLNGAAPSGGAIVSLSSSNPSAATVPPSVTVPAGSSNAAFTITTNAVATNSQSSISASYGSSSKSATATVLPPSVSSVTLNPTSVVGGNPSQGTVILNGAAPSSGAVIGLSSSNTSAATVPANVIVSAGLSAATFAVSTIAVGSNSSSAIGASYGSSSGSATITVLPTTPVVSSVTLNPSNVVGGNSSQGTVTLSGPALSGGALVTLSSSNTSVATVLASVTVGAGLSSATFAISTSAVTANSSSNVTASYNSSSKTASVTVLPPSVSSVTLNPTSVVGGSSSQGTVTLNGAAPTSGAVVGLSSSNTSVATVPVSVTVASGLSSATFTVTTIAVASNNSSNITASYGSSGSATLNVMASLPVLSALTLNPNSVIGGNSSQGTVTLSGAAPAGGATVSLFTSDSTVAAPPVSVSIQPSSTSGSFQVATVSVSNATPITVSGSYNGTTLGATLTVNPQPSGPVFYVAPNGTPSGNGSINSPWDLQTALNQPLVVGQGSTIYLRGGTYKGKFSSNLAGAQSAPIVVRSYPGEWAKIDGYLTTTLATAMNSSQTSIALTNASGFANGCGVRIDNEVMLLNNKSGNSFTDVLRAAAGTTGVAVSHSAGATVILGGAVLNIYGSNTIYRDIEVMDSDPARSDLVNNPSTLIAQTGDGIAVRGAGVQIINCIVHDAQEGITAWSQAPNSVIYGNVIYNVGITCSDRTHGHGLYQENTSGTRLIQDNIVLNSFDLLAQMYGVTGAFVGGTLDGNVFFNGGAGAGNGTYNENLLIGTNSQSIPSVTVTNNCFYFPPGVSFGNLALGFGGVSEGIATVKNNYVAGGSSVGVAQWSSVDFEQNTIVGDQYPWMNVNQPNATTYTFSGNKYFDTSTMQNCMGGSKRAPFQYHYSSSLSAGSCGSFLDFQEWKTAINAGIPSGDSVGSAYTAGRPSANAVIVRPNQFEPKRANIVIYNWQNSATVAVDVSSILSIGDSYEVRNVQDYFNTPVLSGTYNGGTISIPMTALTVAKPIGMSTAPPNTAPAFAAFVIKRP